MLRACLLLTWILGVAHAGAPLFCDRVCSVALDGFKLKYVYVKVPPAGDEARITIRSGGLAGGVALRQARFPLAYGPEDIRGLVGGVSYTKTFNPFLQTVEFEPDAFIVNVTNATDTYEAFLPTTVSEGNVVHIVSGSATRHTVRVLLAIGFDAELTALEVVSLPIAMFLTHGPFWTDQGYYWIFLVTSAILGILYVAFTRSRIWQAIFIAAIAAYTTVGADKLYHSINSAIVAGSAAQIAFAVCVWTLCADGLPIAFSAVYVRCAKCRPIPWSIFAMLASIASIFFAGGGWFLGPTLIFVGALVRVGQRAV